MQPPGLPVTRGGSEWLLGTPSPRLCTLTCPHALAAGLRQTHMPACQHGQWLQARCCAVGVLSQGRAQHLGPVAEGSQPGGPRQDPISEPWYGTQAPLPQATCSLLVKTSGPRLPG